MPNETQLSRAKRGLITPEIARVAQDESVNARDLGELVAAGKVIIPKNFKRAFHPRGIGERLRTKVNANIGSSGMHESIEEELEKLKICVRYGADSVMDLSSGASIDKTRRAIIKNSPLMVGTVPIYQVMVECATNQRLATTDRIFSVIEKQAQDGVDFITIHCGVTRKTAEALDRSERICGIVSRGGVFMYKWIKLRDEENPLYEHFDRLCDIAKKYDVTLSLGDGLRPGSLADASDSAQFQELFTLGELAKYAREQDVQVMIEGPGHMPIDQIEANVFLEKQICDGAPYYVLGPLVIDIAPGYDHITGAIGGAVAAAAGVDMLCYVTPAEHVRLPDIDDVREGIVAFKIAAHAGDIAKNTAGARDRNKKMSERRFRLDWESQWKLAIEPEKPRRMRRESEATTATDVCTMCGDVCAMKNMAQIADAPKKSAKSKK